MNDEIKEILKILKKCEYGAWITKYNTRELIDYITNLQQIEQEHKKLNAELRQENSNLKTSLDEAQEVLSEYKEENERLKNHNRWLEDKIETYFDNVNMQNDLLIEQLDYKSRCEKGIEYIKNRKEEYINGGDTRVRINYWHYNRLINDLLNILQNGSEKDENI